MACYEDSTAGGRLHRDSTGEARLLDAIERLGVPCIDAREPAEMHAVANAGFGESEALSAQKPTPSTA